MAVSVERLYQSVKDDDKYEMRCVAGEKGMDKAVNWVHMVEGLAISEFLDGNEIAFTTGIGMPDDNDALLELVESIYKNRASALVINIGPYIKEIWLLISVIITIFHCFRFHGMSTWQV